MKEAIPKQEFYTRTDAVHQKIKNKFDNIAKSKGGGWIPVYTGIQGIYLFNLCGLCLDTESILDKTVSTPEKPVLVCDVGAGKFGLIRHNDGKYKERIITYGVSAGDLDIGIERENLPGNYVYGNAEYLSELPELREKKFHYIFSRSTYMHFVDPIGSIIEAYNKLEVNGILMVDTVNIPGCEKFILLLPEFLKVQGYRVATGFQLGKILSFIIQKTDHKPTLDFPVVFKCIENNVVKYQPNDELLNFKSKIEETYYRNGLKQLHQTIRSQNLDGILNKHNTLPSLLNDEHYQALDITSQRLLILACSTQYFRNFSQAQEFVAGISGRLSKQGLTLFNMYVTNTSDLTANILLFADYTFFPNLKAQEQQYLILAFSTLEILVLGKQGFEIQTLKEMGLPYFQDSSLCWSIKLLAPKVAGSQESLMMEEVGEEIKGVEPSLPKFKDTINDRIPNNFEALPVSEYTGHDILVHENIPPEIFKNNEIKNYKEEISIEGSEDSEDNERDLDHIKGIEIQKKVATVQLTLTDSSAKNSARFFYKHEELKSEKNNPSQTLCAIV